MGWIAAAVTSSAGAIYALLTWSEPDRAALLGVAVLGIVSAFVIPTMPQRRIVAARYGVLFFYAWSITLLAFISAAVVLDGGARSPLVAMFYLPLLFVATAYPPEGVLFIGTLLIGGYVTVGAVASDVSFAHVLFIAITFGIFTAMAAVLARSHWVQHRSRGELTRRLAALAHTDGLTGCLNHRALHERLREELAAGRGRELSLVVADLDLFKKVNDEHGHPAGDELLGEVARRIMAAAPQGAAVARSGGDEFSVLLPGMLLEEAMGVAETVRAAVHEADGPSRPTVSVGVSAYPRRAQTGSDLLGQADLALYAAKRAGRDCVRVFGAELQLEEAARRATPDLGLRRRLHSVIERNAITAVFQPVVSLQGAGPLGYEALCRIDGSGMGPDRWLALAAQVEMRGLLEVEMWKAVLRAGSPPDDALLFLNAGPEALLAGALEPYRDRFGTEIVIELSEEQAVADYAALAEVLREWGDAGVRIAVDDVGSGHANLDHVLQIAPDFLKLDRGLISGVHADAARLALVEAIVSFAAQTGSIVIAEGVETEEDAGVLSGAGVEYGQGWLFARPASPWTESAWSPSAQLQSRP